MTNPESVSDSLSMLVRCLGICRNQNHRTPSPHELKITAQNAINAILGNIDWSRIGIHHAGAELEPAKGDSEVKR